MTFQPPTRSAHPDDAYHHALELLEEPDPRGAISLLDPAIEAEPHSTGLRTLRAWAYFQSAQLCRAEDELTNLVEECPTDLWARYALGRVLERQSKFTAALPHMRLAAVMSGDPEHEAGMLRVERRLAEKVGSYDDLT
jgi:predicted Zn-dependent protease